MAKAKAEVKSNSESGVKYVYSTLTTDMSYSVDDEDNPNVYIHGGANTTNKYGVTSLGAVTEVSTDRANLLEKNRVFGIHKENGFILVLDNKVEIEVAIDSMTKQDKSAPDTPADADQMYKDSVEGGLNGLVVKSGEDE